MTACRRNTRTVSTWAGIYKKPLTVKQIRDYELTPAPDNPDRKRSITARLKEGAAKGQEPPKESGQKRNHKAHEDR